MLTLTPAGHRPITHNFRHTRTLGPSTVRSGLHVDRTTHSTTANGAPRRIHWLIHARRPSPRIRVPLPRRRPTFRPMRPQSGALKARRLVPPDGVGAAGPSHPGRGVFHDDSGTTDKCGQWLSEMLGSGVGLSAVMPPGFIGRFVLDVRQSPYIPPPPEYSPVGRAPKYPKFRPPVADLTNNAKEPQCRPDRKCPLGSFPDPGGCL